MADYDSAILPGGEGKVTASIDTARLRGPITKSVTITTNDPARPTFALRLRANVEYVLDVLPSDRVSMTGRVGTIQPHEFQLVAKDGEPFDVLEVHRAQFPWLGIDWKPAPELAKARADGSMAPAREPAPGAVFGGHSAYKATITAAPETPIGRHVTNIRLTTSHPKEEEVRVNLNLRCTGNLSIQPERITLRSSLAGRLRPGQDWRVRPVMIRALGGRTVNVESAEIDGDGFEAKVETLEEGNSYSVEVRFTGANDRGHARATLKVKTNDDLQPMIEIPLNAVIDG